MNRAMLGTLGVLMDKVHEDSPKLKGIKFNDYNACHTKQGMSI